MKLTIIAATGGIGRQLLEQAIAAGHDVTAVARNPQHLSPAPARAVGQNIRRGLFVSRADVAHYMLSIPDQAETFRRTVGIAY